jgi:dihydroceramidase
MTIISKFWGEEDASVHFCENKYEEVFWIAEYYNSMSSLSYILVGLLFWDSKISHLGNKLIMVGMGAFILHMTLRHYAQMVDESAMILLSYDTIRHIKPQLPKWGLIILLMFYVMFTDSFVYFLLLFTILKLYIARQMYVKRGGNSVVGGIFFLCYILLFILGTTCWIMDQILCEQVKNYQMHALWHIFTSISIGCGMMALIYTK